MAHDYYSPMHLALAVKCPVCEDAASFAFATYVRIARNVDLSYFEKSKAFEVKRCQDSCGGFYNVAAHFSGLGSGLETVEDLPSGYEIRKWYRKHYWTPGIEGYEGVIQCDTCLLPKKHKLSWPFDAYFQIEYKDEVLWAYDRSTALKLLNYIDSDGRKKRITGTTKWRGQEHEIVSQDYFLRKIPTVFQMKKARAPIVKKLRKILDLT